MLCLLGMEGILLAAWLDRVALARPLQALTRGKQGPGGTARPLGPPEDRVALEGDAPLVQQKDTSRSNNHREARADPESPAAAPPAQALGGRNAERRGEARRAGKGGAGSAGVGWGSPTEPAGGRSSAPPSSRCGDPAPRPGSVQGR